MTSKLHELSLWGTLVGVPKGQGPVAEGNSMFGMKALDVQWWLLLAHNAVSDLVSTCRIYIL
jgi:hypothetical protein